MPLLANAQVSVASAPGTGATVSLGAARPGAQTWAAAGAADGLPYSYRIDDAAGNWEIQASQTYGASAATLTRGTPAASSNNNAPVNFGADAFVSQIALPGDLSSAISVFALPAVASADIIIPASCNRFRLALSNLTFTASGACLGLQFVDANGPKSASGDYNTQVCQQYSNSLAGFYESGSFGSLVRNAEGGSGTLKALSNFLIFPGGSGAYPGAVGHTYRRGSDGNPTLEIIGINYVGATSGAMGRATKARLYCNTGNVSGNVTAYGET